MFDQKALKEVANLNDAAIAVFDKYSERERFRRNVNLKRLRRELSHEYGDIDAKQLLATFERLQELGLGSIVYGSGGKDTQFYWHFSLKDLAQAAKGKIPISQLQPLKPLKGHPPMPMIRKTQSSPEVNTTANPHPITKSGPGELQIFIVNQNNQLKRFKIPAQNNAAVMTLLSSLGEAQ